MTVSQLLRSADSAELSEWSEYFRLESERGSAALPETQENVADALKKAFNCNG